MRCQSLFFKFNEPIANITMANELAACEETKPNFPPHFCPNLYMSDISSSSRQGLKRVKIFLITYDEVTSVAIRAKAKKRKKIQKPWRELVLKATNKIKTINGIQRSWPEKRVIGSFSHAE